MWMHMATSMLGAKRVQREFLLGRFLKQMTIRIPMSRYLLGKVPNTYLF
jgi:hypothetical protein